MHNATPPPSDELPSARALLRSTAAALAVAALLLVTVVLPAEYGIDPTGVGRVLGLTRMGEIKTALVREAAAAEAAEAASVAAATEALAGGTSDPAAHVTRLTLGPGESTEVKLAMREGARVSYSWATDRGVVGYDLHGDRADAPRGSYHSYEQGAGAWSDEGALTAAFDGRHGWFWHNRTDEALTLTLRTEGAYLDLQRLDE